MWCRNVMSVGWLFAGMLALTLVAQPVQAEIEFGIPTPVPFPINDENGNGHPWISQNELTLYFTSSRPGTAGLVDIWMSERQSMSDPWRTPVNLGAPINTDGIDYFPSVTGDSRELYFTRTTDFAGVSDGEIWVSKRTDVDQPWSEPEKLAITQLGDGRPSISSDGLNLYFNSFGGREPPPEFPQILSIWHTSRNSTSEPFGEPEFYQIGNGTVGLSSDGLLFGFSATATTADFYGLTLFDPPGAGLRGDILLMTRETADQDFGPIIGPVAPLSSSFFDESNQFGVNDSSIYFASTRPGVPAIPPLGAFGIWRAPIAESVPVDIKPGSDPNPINLKNKGVLPVAILSTGEFDATLVDVDTLLFGDPLLIADGKTPVSPLRSNYEDVDYDGLDDLTLKFSMRDLLENEVIGTATVQGYLAGQLVDGTEIAGRDMVIIVPASKAIPEPSSLLLILVGVLALANCRRS